MIIGGNLVNVLPPIIIEINCYEIIIIYKFNQINIHKKNLDPTIEHFLKLENPLRNIPRGFGGTLIPDKFVKLFLVE
jgi:hypothetical protein